MSSNAFNDLQRAEVRRDEHGAYTLVGAEIELVGVTPKELGMKMHITTASSGKGDDAWCIGRRIWLAGISAQRGY